LSAFRARLSWRRPPPLEERPRYCWQIPSRDTSVASYGIYLWHCLLALIVLSLPIEAGVGLSLALWIALVVAVASASFFGIERVWLARLQPAQTNVYAVRTSEVLMRTPLLIIAGMIALTGCSSESSGDGGNGAGGASVAYLPDGAVVPTAAKVALADRATARAERRPRAAAIWWAPGRSRPFVSDRSRPRRAARRRPPI
jgi:hypothetical protein